MKNGLLLIVSLTITIMMFASCSNTFIGQIVQTPAEQQMQEPTDDVLSNTEDSALSSPPGKSGTESELAAVGVITGDVFYKKIEVGRILYEQPENSLGTPLYSDGPYYFYDGLELYFTEYVDVISGTNLSLLTIDGVALDKNRAELIAAFGNPIEYYKYPGYLYRGSDDDRMIRYHVSSYAGDYMLDFWFEHSEDKAYIISIKRMGQ